MSNYPQITLNDAGKELDRLHGEIENKMRSTVADAIRAGEILFVVKDSVGHGEFLPWIKANCSFGSTTADKYRKLYEYGSKIPPVGNLQEAYKQVESLEAQAKQSESKKAYQRVVEYQRTGIKPEGWRRGTDDDLYKREIEYKQKSQERQKGFDDAKEQKRLDEEKLNEERIKRRIESEMLKSMAEMSIKHIEKKNEFKKRIKLSQSGESDLFIDALMDYLDELPDDNRRIEACNNIVKVCRNISVELQRGK